MPVEQWSNRVTLARLADDPQLTEDLLALEQAQRPHDVVLDFSGVNYINSSHLARLLKLRKKMISADRKMLLCGLEKQVWGAFAVTGLEKVFHISDDVATALATLQIER